MSSAVAQTVEAPMVLRADADGVATLTLNRPDARNALSSELMAEVQAQLDAIRSDDSIKVVVIAGAGPGFCAGHDLKEIRDRKGQEGDRAAFDALLAQCSKMMMSIVHLPKPVIAKVHGIATAAGCQLVASCDIAIAEDGARFATPGVNIGLFCSTPMVALSRAVGRKHAMEMLFSGQLFPAEKAIEFGLINRAVPADKLDDEVYSLAKTIAEKSPLVLATGKEAFYRQLEMPLEEAYEYCSVVMAENMMARDADEGIAAFMEKRKPVWRGE